MTTKRKNNGRATIAVLGPYPPASGGISTNIRHLLNSLLKDKYNLCPFHTGSQKYGTFDYSREKIHSKIVRFIKSLFYYIVFLIRHSPDVIHINTSFGQYSFWRDLSYLVISKLFRKHIILQMHGGSLDEFRRRHSQLSNRLMTKIFRMPERILVLSSIQKEPFRALNILHRVEVVPNMIDTTKFNKKSNYRDGLGISSDVTVVLFVAAHFFKEKGVWDVLEAISLVTKDYEQVLFVLVGGGKEEKAMKQFCHIKRLGKFVKFTGHLFNEVLINVFLSSDIFILPTYSEGFPLVILEAMAAGLPVISTPIRAIPDIIEDGVNGFLIEPRNPAALAEKIIQLIEDKTLLKTMGENNKKKVKEKYDLEPVAKIFDNIYSELLSGGNK